MLLLLLTFLFTRQSRRYYVGAIKICTHPGPLASPSTSKPDTVSCWTETATEDPDGPRLQTPQQAKHLHLAHCRLTELQRSPDTICARQVLTGPQEDGTVSCTCPPRGVRPTDVHSTSPLFVPLLPASLPARVLKTLSGPGGRVECPPLYSEITGDPP